MDPILVEINKVLVEGLKRSKQGSYERRAPSNKSLPYLGKALSGLVQYTRDHPDCADAWRMRSLAEESLLRYGAAVSSLDRALSFSPQRPPKDLKRLALLKEYASKWRALMLDPLQLVELGEYLVRTLAIEPCDHRHSQTRKWLENAGVNDAEQVLKAIENFGGYCDCEVLNNVVKR